MNSTPGSTANRTHHRPLWVALRYLLLVTAVGVLAVAAVAYRALHRTLPQRDGVLKLAGLTAAVDVTWDARAVPTIEAKDLDDLFFSQGYLTAQDRLWQMDGTRRYAAGELAEVLGEDFLKHDRQQRILSLRPAAEKIVALMTPETKQHFEDYARGVNAYIENHRGKLPVEFTVLRYSPKAWTPTDSALIAAQMVEDLSATPRAALLREKLLAKLGPELTDDLFVNESPHSRAPGEHHESSAPKRDGSDDDELPDSSVAGMRTPSAKTDVSAIQAAPDSWYRQQENFTDGSNEWVVSGSHTVTGRPLLCNDMHLAHQLPNLWYEAHLKSGDFDVAGVTLPGLPYVIAGHNQKIAWGFTNLGPTVEDAYIETFNDQGQNKTPSGWRQAEVRKETIKVKGKPDVALDVLTTRHGPVVTELMPEEKRKVALRWTLLDGIRTPFFAINSAQNWDQFVKAFASFDAPAQNVVYADVEGNIGYHATGRIPLRAKGKGELPEDGSTDEFEWKSYIPYEALPNVFNPPSGVIATANARITPNKYPFSLSVQWEAPWRTERIYRVLESGKKFAAADMLALQMDIYSDFDHFVASKVASAVEQMSENETGTNPSARAKIAAEMLRGWDGRMSGDSAAPTIATRVQREIQRMLLEPKLGASNDDEEAQGGWRAYHWMMSTVWLENVLEQEPARWLPQGLKSFDELEVQALEHVVKSGAAPPELSSWHWGDENLVDIEHPVFGKIPLLKRWAGTGVNPQDGSRYTVKAVSAHHGPSDRMTIDLANLDESTLNLVTGQAGHILSDNFLDQWSAWYTGFTFQLPFSAKAVAQGKAHGLRFEPK